MDGMNAVNTTPPPRDWATDFAHENGNYLCSCMHCKQPFYGYKRRVVCQECFNKLHLRSSQIPLAIVREGGTVGG